MTARAISIASFVMLIALHAAFAAQPLRVIVNHTVKVSHIDSSSLRSIFGMRISRWPDGTPIKVFVLPDHSPLHEQFAKSLLNTYPHQLRRNWDRMVYSGTGTAPIQVQNEQEMIQKIQETPGAIGYSVVPEETNNVQVISTP